VLSLLFLGLGFLTVWVTAVHLGVKSDPTLIALLVVPILIWGVATDRVRRVAGGGFEVDLAYVIEAAGNAATVPDSKYTALLDDDLGRIGPKVSDIASAPAPTVVESDLGIVNAMARVLQSRDARFVRITLGREPPYTSVRLFLLAALAEDYTDVREFVIVDRDGQMRYRFVGLAVPNALRRAMAQQQPALQSAYQAAYASHPPAPGSLSSQRSTELASHVELLRDAIAGADEPGQRAVTAEAIRAWLGADLEQSTVEFKDAKFTPAVVKKIINLPIPYGRSSRMVSCAGSLIAPSWRHGLR
jgi:hypothetical protein